MKSDLLDLTMQRHAETEKAILVSDDGDKAKAVWLPKAQIEIAPTESQKQVVIITLPDWLAIERGLV